VESDARGGSRDLPDGGGWRWRPLGAGVLGPRRRAAIVVLALGLPALAALLGSWLLTGYLWFAGVGHADVFWSVLELRAGLLAAAGGGASVCLLATLRTAVRRAAVDVPRPPALAGAAACVAVGGAIGLWAMRQWPTVMMWMHRSQFGVVDSVHHWDAGFFVFTLPVLEAAADISLAVAMIASALAAAVYALSGVLSLAPLRATATATGHLAVLGAIALAGLSWRLILVTYSLEISGGGSTGVTSFPGADYVDLRVRIPALDLLALLALLFAAALIAAAWLAAHGHARAGAHVAAWQVLATSCVALLALVVIPWLVQRFVVDPQPLVREQPELQSAIDATRQAFSLADVRVVPQEPRAQVSRHDAAADSGLLANVQVWDSSVLAAQMRQLTSGTPYLRVRTPTLDVESVNGGERLTAFAEQEIDDRLTSGRAAGWSDARMVYTHGLGAVGFSASQVGSDGEPRRQQPAPLSQPRIYFGRQPPGNPAWVVVNTRRSEVDRPIPADQPEEPYHYAGTGGIALSSWIRRAAFAIRLHSLALLLSSDITPRSRIIAQRDVIQRLTTLAGFIRWDPSVAAVPVSGRVVFLADGYTTSSSYPQSESVRLAGGSANYARASVVATVDAYSGDIHLYLSDSADPVARAWAAAFPGLFQPMSDFPSGLRPNLRYPPALFAAQASIYQQFHARTPAAFASGADAWGRPTSLSGPIGGAGDIRFGTPRQEAGHELRPSYQLMVPAGSHGPAALVRTTLYTPPGGQNVVAELEGWVGDRGQPRLSLLSFSGDRVIPGPAQISRLMLTTPSITDALGLINKETTDLDQHSLLAVLLGTPRWLLFAGTVLQVQSIYTQASGAGVTRMLGVTVFVDGRAAISRTLGRALRRAASPP
jgi:uncharacterized protein